MDSDFHKILDGGGQQINPDEEVKIGDHVWINSRVTILKGTQVPNNTVIASGALLAKPYHEENTLLAGVPARVLKTGISWDY